LSQPKGFDAYWREYVRRAEAAGWVAPVADIRAAYEAGYAAGVADEAWRCEFIALTHGNRHTIAQLIREGRALSTKQEEPGR
jgi:hypothetical protein